MILVVEGNQFPPSRLDAALGARSIHRVPTVTAARAWCVKHDPTVILLSGPLHEVRAFTEDVRAGAFGDPAVPIVAVVEAQARGGADRIGADEIVVAPVEDAALREAIENAILLGEYKDAVDTFFEVSRAHASESVADSPDEWAEVVSARDRADRHLEALRRKNLKIPFERLLSKPATEPACEQ